MKRILLTFAVLLMPLFAKAYEYHLQVATSGRKGLSVIGEAYNADGTVSGNLSFYTQYCQRYVCGPKHYFYGTGVWDGQGNAINIVETPWPAQSPIATNGTEIIYATSGASATGRDTRGFGFVDTPASHFTWQTTNPSYFVIPDTLYTFQVTLSSDGDFPLNVSAETVTTSPSGTYTPTGGTATVLSTDCNPNPVAPGTSCVVTVQYDPTTIAHTGSPYGYAYTNLTLHVTSDAGNMPDWSTGFTITGVPRLND